MGGIAWLGFAQVHISRQEPKFCMHRLAEHELPSGDTSR